MQLARTMWHLVLDGKLSLTEPVFSKEFWRLMKLAKATKEDL
jgi:hypothetical protein